jgi:hypothetical protein
VKQEIYSHRQKFKTYLDRMAFELDMKEVLQRKPDTKTEDSFARGGTILRGQNRLDCSPHEEGMCK